MAVATYKPKFSNRMIVVVKWVCGISPPNAFEGDLCSTALAPIFIPQ
jgi:hypothetical protein